MLLADIIDSLDRHSGASTAILTGALVLITAYYAIQNRGMVREMQRARRATVLPKLALEFHRLGPTAMTLAIRNVGPGAALAVDVRIVWESITGGDTPETRWRRNVLAPGEQADFMPPGPGINDNLNALPARYQAVRLIGTCTDAAGTTHAVSEAFEDLPGWRGVLHDAHQRWVAADPERRLAEELAKRFEPPLRDIQRSVESLAGALTPAQNDVSDAAAKPPHPSSRVLAWWRTLRPARRAN